MCQLDFKASTQSRDIVTHLGMSNSHFVNVASPFCWSRNLKTVKSRVGRGAVRVQVVIDKLSRLVRIGKWLVNNRPLPGRWRSAKTETEEIRLPYPAVQAIQRSGTVSIHLGSDFFNYQSVEAVTSLRNYFQTESLYKLSGLSSKLCAARLVSFPATEGDQESI